jgi:FkbM family methyltransferase
MERALSGVLAKAGNALNRCFSWNASLANSYLNTWAVVLGILPDGNWLKAHVGNNLRQTSWPPLALKERKVELANGIEGLLIPAAGSLSFRALFERRIGHEPGVPEFLRSRLQMYDAVLEVGANVGIYTLLFSKCLESRPAPSSGPHRVFSFEPGVQAFAQLEAHLALNGCSNVRAFNQAVAAKSGLIAFHENARDLMKSSTHAGGAAHFAGWNEQPTTVLAASGKEIAPLLSDFERVLVKIDVVGAEADVLSGLRAVIDEKSPDLVVGVWSHNLPELNELQFLTTNYDFFRIEPDRLVERSGFEDQDYCNYFLQHKRC